MVSYLCQLAGISRSGYYAWLKGETNRQLKEESDEKDAELLIEIFHENDGKVGALQIKMILENNYDIILNHKKIRRLMKKFRLMTKIRRANPYKHMMKATQKHRTCDNLLNREFDKRGLVSFSLQTSHISTMAEHKKLIYRV